MSPLRGDVEIVPVTREHAPSMLRWMCDPVVSRNLGLRAEPSLDTTLAWIENAQNNPARRPFAVLFCGAHVGNVVLDQIDSYLNSARLSVYIGEHDARGRGVGCTAVALALMEGFEALHLHKVYLTVHSGNFAAINTYARLGFALEGVLRDEFWLDGRRCPALYMGLLREDFARLMGER